MQNQQGQDGKGGPEVQGDHPRRDGYDGQQLKPKPCAHHQDEVQREHNTKNSLKLREFAPVSNQVVNEVAEESCGCDETDDDVCHFDAAPREPAPGFSPVQPEATAGQCHGEPQQSPEREKHVKQSNRGACTHAIPLMIAVALLITGCGRGCSSTPGDDAPGALPIAGIPSSAPDGAYRQEGAGGVVLLEGDFSQGKPTGEWIARYPDGAERARGRFDAEGRPVGEWISRWPDGVLQERGSYVAGEADGLWQMYWSDGSLFEALRMKDGAPHGEWRMYFRGGVLADVMQFEAGVQVGVESDFARDGRKLAEGRFENGEPVGDWTCWSEAGQARTISAPRDRDQTPREACGHPALPELEID